MSRLWMWCVALALVGLWFAPAQAVVGGAPAAPPEPDAAVVFTQRHGFSSRIEGIKDEKLGYYSFFGIRLQPENMTIMTHDSHAVDIFKDDIIAATITNITFCLFT